MKPAVSRSGVALKGGLPVDGKLTCFGCDASCSARLECAQCLEIYRARAVVAARDCTFCAFGRTERDALTRNLPMCRVAAAATGRLGARLLLHGGVLPHTLARVPLRLLASGAFVTECTHAACASLRVPCLTGALTARATAPPHTARLARIRVFMHFLVRNEATARLLRLGS